MSHHGYIDNRHAMRVHYQDARRALRNYYESQSVRDVLIAKLAREYREAVEIVRAYYVYETIEPHCITRRKVAGDNGSFTS